MAQLLHYK